MPSSQTAGRRRTFIPWRFPSSGGGQESFPCWSQAVNCREEGNGLLGHLCLHYRLQHHHHVSPLCPRTEEKLSTIINAISLRRTKSKQAASTCILLRQNPKSPTPMWEDIIPSQVQCGEPKYFNSSF